MDFGFEEVIERGAAEEKGRRFTAKAQRARRNAEG